MKLVLKIALGVALGVVLLFVGCGVLVGGTAAVIEADNEAAITRSVEEAGVTPNDTEDPTISYAEYESVKVGEVNGNTISRLVQRFGNPSRVVDGREISVTLNDTYSWNMEGGGFMDTYDFEVNPDTGRVVSKMDPNGNYEDETGSF